MTVVVVILLTVATYALVAYHRRQTALVDAERAELALEWEEITTAWRGLSAFDQEVLDARIRGFLNQLGDAIDGLPGGGE